MSNESIANNGSVTQDPAHTKQLVEAFFIDQIAEAVYRLDRRDAGAKLKDLDPMSQDRYRADAMVVAYMRDPKKVTPAMYFAADGITRGGVGSRPRAMRVLIVGILELAFSRFRKALSAQESVTVDRFQILAEADGEDARRMAEANAAAIEFSGFGDVPKGVM